MSRLRDKGGTTRGAVLIVGVGGLGTAAAIELVFGGIDRIGLIDGDCVELSNLHRQLLHGAADVGRPKAEVAAEKLAAVRESTRIDTHVERLTAANAEEILRGYDFVIDATDDIPTKFLLNDACVGRGKPFVHAGVVGLRGQLMTILPRRSACLRCLFPEPPAEGEIASCQQAGILGPLAGLIGALEGREAVKYLSSAGDLAADRLITIDARTLRVRDVPLRRFPRCKICGPRAAIDADRPAPSMLRESRRSKEIS
ncbi:MAG TPA: HesA/MoeB/ThiF family protein [Candidatus Binatia bacterium]|nr:HesA/MoeB/ThiF family protein [Candidatus Binatia bacterium]